MRASVTTLFLSLALTAGCSGGAEEPVSAPALQPHVEPTATASAAPVAPSSPAAERDQEPVPLALAIGYTTLPEEPAAAALAALRAGLAVHARGDYAGSEAAFRAVAEAHPGYAMARFDHACALSRLTRLDEAAAIIEALLAVDYPTFVGRLDDPDLAALREGERGAALDVARARVEAAYRAALREGVPVVRVEDGQARDVASRRTVQAGVWLATPRRFVPMAPATTITGVADHTGMFAARSTTVLDRERDVVITMHALSSNSEWGDFLSSLRGDAYEAVTGRLLGRIVPSCPEEGCIRPRMHALTMGAALATEAEALDGTLDVRRTRGAEGRYDPRRVPALECSQSGCRVEGAPSLPDGVTLPAGLAVDPGPRE